MWRGHQHHQTPTLNTDHRGVVRAHPDLGLLLCVLLCLYGPLSAQPSLYIFFNVTSLSCPQQCEQSIRYNVSHDKVVQWKKYFYSVLKIIKHNVTNQLNNKRLSVKCK